MSPGQHDENQHLAQFYASLADEELLRISSEPEELTEAARAALASELQSRHMEPVQQATGVDITEPQDLVVIRQFRDPGDAMVAKTILESSGIEAFLGDDNMIRLDWFISNLLGGIKLKVNAEDAQSADDILNQPVPPDFQVEGAGDFVQPRCPKCNSLEIIFTGLNKPASYATMFINFPIPIRDNKWKCEDCGYEWQDIPEDSNQPGSDV